MRDGQTEAGGDSADQRSAEYTRKVTMSRAKSAIVRLRASGRDPALMTDAELSRVRNLGRMSIPVLRELVCNDRPQCPHCRLVIDTDARAPDLLAENERLRAALGEMMDHLCGFNPCSQWEYIWEGVQHARESGSAALARTGKDGGASAGTNQEEIA